MSEYADRIKAEMKRRAERRPPSLPPTPLITHFDPDRDPIANPVRHLSYHIYPIGERWKWNVDELLKRRCVFNGSRNIAIAVDANTATPDEVMSRFSGFDADFSIVPNDPVGHEMSSFFDLLGKCLRYQGESDITFRAHAKAVTHPFPMCHEWVSILYAANLDYPFVADNVLARFNCAGSLKNDATHFDGNDSTWDYSGSFYWLRNQFFAGRDWRYCGGRWDAKTTRYIPEVYPCHHVKREDAGVVFYNGLVRGWVPVWSPFIHRWENAVGRFTPLFQWRKSMSHQQQRDFSSAVVSMFRNRGFNFARVLDAGSQDINGNNRHLFPDSRYIGIDVGEGPNVDAVCSADKFEAEPFDCIISTEMLEHCALWRESLVNLFRLLKPGGLFILTCAGPGRPEHGTSKSKSEDSPFTNDHYRNVSVDEIMSALPSELWSELTTEYDGKHKDTRIWGVKA